MAPQQYNLPDDGRVLMIAVTGLAAALLDVVEECGANIGEVTIQNDGKGEMVTTTPRAIVNHCRAYLFDHGISGVKAKATKD